MLQPDEFHVAEHGTKPGQSTKTPSYFYLKYNVSETASCLRLQVTPTQLGPIDGARSYLRNSSID
jgi:hypothetical protein